MFKRKIGPSAEKHYHVQYHATFNNQALKTHLGYFGRTYKSPMLPLVPSLKHQVASTNQLLRCEAPDFIYFHTSLKHELTKIIVEIIVIEETVRVDGGPS